MNANTGTGQKKSLLVIFPKNHIGGSMTALMNFLRTIDPERYEVDLLLREYGKDMPEFPNHVHVLEPAKIAWEWKNLFRLLPGMLNPLYYGAKLIVKIREHYGWSGTLSSQIIMQNNLLFNRRLEKTYDVALAYELNWCLYYLVKRVKARKKILLIHNDYHTIGYKFQLDRRFFRRMDTVAFVSDACMEKFLEQHPEYREKARFLPNITASQPIIDRSLLPVEPDLPEMTGKLRLLSISRVSFDAKGIDRIIPVCLRLREEGLLDRLSWVILGGGDDLKRLRGMIEEQDLGHNVFAMGKTSNPMPWLKHFDAMMLPSRTEGKPLAVTEAQILGVPPVVTRYTSAETQIEHGVDGIILENNDESLYQGIKDLVLNPEKLEPLRRTVRSRRYSNEEDIDYFYRMVDELF